MRKILYVILLLLVSITANARSVITDTETEKLVNEIIAPIARAADVSHLKIHIIGDDDFNAFVSGGDDVYIYTGLLKQIKTPNALQAVIAHELGHTIGGHMAQMSAQMDAELMRTMIIQALGVGLMVAGGNPSLGAGVLAGGTGIANQSLMAFSRDEERIADTMAIDLLVRAKQNPNGLITVFEQMQEMTSAMESKINPNRVNHPLTMERLKNARDKIASLKYNYDASVYDKWNRQYELVRAKLVGYLDPLDRVHVLYPNSDKSDAAIYARAIANMRGGNLESARIGTLTLISRDTKNPYFYELFGDIEYQFGHYDDSVNAYEKALEYVSDAPQIQTALALVLSDRKKPGDTDRAIELTKTAILSEPSPLAYWVMARAYGEDARAYWAMAEFYKLNGNEKQAREYAKRARKSLPTSSPEYIKSGDILNSVK
ncbi:MAG: M48 family metalloprotease [Proteobacteria bacterium]|nr:M48 family metalloprotease [Candidatus Enterousia scatequi]